MSEVKHTPLPWSVDNTDGDQGHLLGQPSNHCSDVIGTLYDLDLPEGQANARLIVQAVNNYYDLLGLLREAADFIQPFNRAEDLLDRIDAAISKATMGEGGEG